MDVLYSVFLFVLYAGLALLAVTTAGLVVYLFNLFIITPIRKSGLIKKSDALRAAGDKERSDALSDAAWTIDGRMSEAKIFFNCCLVGSVALMASLFYYMGTL